jgi:hypothetical protein
MISEISLFIEIQKPLRLINTIDQKKLKALDTFLGDSLQACLVDMSCLLELPR